MWLTLCYKKVKSVFTVSSGWEEGREGREIGREKGKKEERREGRKEGRRQERKWISLRVIHLVNMASLSMASPSK